MIKKTGVPFHVELNSHQKYFGATGFITKVANLIDGTISVSPNDAEEIVEEIETAKTASVAAAAAAGARTISVESSELEDGMVFDDGKGNMYYIESATADTITLKFPLKEAIAYGDTLTQVGNTGVYKIELNMAAEGNYGVYISNPNIDMRMTGMQIAVRDIIVEDVYEKVQETYDDLSARLAEVQSAVTSSAENDFEVYSS